MKKSILSVVFFLTAFFGFMGMAKADGDSAKLDQVIQSQNQILTKLDEIKAELAIVKVRASQKG